MFIIRAGILVITGVISPVGDRLDGTFRIITICPESINQADTRFNRLHQ